MVRSILFLFALACALAFAGLGTAAAETNDDDEIGSGRLRVVTKGFKDVDVPLAHTEVEAFVSGFVTRVNVTQKFINPYDDPIEAVYVFPLPAEAAVDDMTMTVGERVIKGVIKKREEAREIYEQAKAAGKTASLLDQERPNIFTQAVANILPGDNIEIRISYVEVLKYEEGGYEFVFPMVVGPRYIPGEQIIGKQGGGWAPDTNRVPDASRITPPVLKPGERSGHDIGVTVHLDAGVPIQDLRSPSHMIVIDDKDDHRATIKLDARDTIPNKDLIVRYDVAGDAPEFGVLTHGEKGRGEFLLVLAPMADYSERDVRPREILFVVDSSGSQQGDPLAKSKDAVKRALKGLRPNDTFQVYDFNDTVTAMAPGPLPATAANVRDAMKFVDQIQATGGTRMLPAIQAALNWPADKERVRIVFMTTDGFIGNEVEIIREIHDHLGDARLFSLGVGSSVNRYLLDRMAEEGRGFVQFVRQDESTKEVVEKFHKRIDAPLMTDIAVDWDGLEVTDVYPDTIPDLFAGQPVVIHGRYTKPGRGTVRLIGNKGRGRTELTADVVFPRDGGYNALETMWARAKIERLMAEMEAKGFQQEKVDLVTDLGLTHRLVTKYTSFVAVEEKVRNVGGKMQTVQVPVEMPEGVSYEGVFGEAETEEADMAYGLGSVGGGRASSMGAPAKMKAMSRAASGAPAPSTIAQGAVMADEAADFGGHGGPQLDAVAFLGVTDQNAYRTALGKAYAKDIAKKLAALGLQAHGKAYMVRLTLASDGSAKKVEILTDEVNDAKARKIIEDGFKKIKLPAPGKEAALVFYIRF